MKRCNVQLPHPSVGCLYHWLLRAMWLRNLNLWREIQVALPDVRLQQPQEQRYPVCSIAVCPDNGIAIVRGLYEDRKRFFLH